ncbi:MAG: penicillin-binding protein activator [Methylobacter sp.]
MRLNHKPPLLCALLPSLLLFPGCAARPPVTQEAPKQEVLITQPLANNDKPEQKTEVYQQAIPPRSTEQNQQRLQAIDTLIQAGDGNAAKQVTDMIDPAELSPEQRAQLAILYAQILLSFGEAEQALDNLSQLQPQQLPPDKQIKYFQAQAFAYSLTGNLLDSAKARMALHPLIAEPEQREKNQAAILETLNLLPDTELQTHQTDDAAAWLSLATILKAINQPDFNQQISQWRATFPTHPADLRFLNSPDDTPDITSQPIKAIALLLPKSGAFAQAGNAIRAGFMAAYNHADNIHKPSIRFYDSEQTEPRALYELALAEGAQLIIGPLAKEQIQILADSVDFEVPVLALNHIPGLQRQRLYQFSLSPLDDSEQVTEKAWEDGHQKALLLVPDNAPGQRSATYLSEHWENHNGHILEMQTYNPKETDFSAPIQKLLNLDESEQRYQKILTLIPSAQYTPRKRQDADAILLSAHSAEARLLNPQLQLYQAGNLPVYALPSIYSGQIDAVQDARLDKITFCDTPWLFDPAYPGELGMAALAETWSQFPSSYLRLIAMGIDAYKLATRLDTLDATPYPGATGTLSLSTDQRIRRKLLCARFVNGQPQPIGIKPALQAQPTDHAVY